MLGDRLDAPGIIPIDQDPINLAIVEWYDIVTDNPVEDARSKPIDPGSMRYSGKASTHGYREGQITAKFFVDRLVEVEAQPSDPKRV